MLPVLLDSAVRSLFLGFMVWVSLKVVRLSDTRTETTIWTAVLIAAFLMPLLSHHVPGLVMTVSRLSAAAPPIETALELLDAPRFSPPGAGISMSPVLAWHAHHGRVCLMAVYFLGFSVCAIRLALGLLLTARLYRHATPVQPAWGHAHNIRVTTKIRSPVSLARTILLPADYGEWSTAKRSAVLAHEEAHIARGDFFVQMAALIHCAFFWFSPFAWWLQRKLAEIAETASDEAAIRRLNDRATYAEILVDVSRRAQKSPLLVAMAKSSLIEQRIEHILSDEPSYSLSLPQRVLAVAFLAALMIGVAGAKAAVEPMVGAPPAEVPAVPKSPMAPPLRKRVVVTARDSDIRSAHIAHGNHGAPSEPQDRDVPSYNPRALLDPVYTPKPNYVPASTIVHAGRAYYVRSTEKPVADVSVTYAMNRRIH